MSDYERGGRIAAQHIESGGRPIEARTALAKLAERLNARDAREFVDGYLDALRRESRRAV